MARGPAAQWRSSRVRTSERAGEYDLADVFVADSVTLPAAPRPRRTASPGQRGDSVASSRASGRRGGEPASNGTAEPSRGPRAEVEHAEGSFPFLLSPTPCSNSTDLSAPRDLQGQREPPAMVTTTEIALLILVLALLFGAFRIIKTVKPLIVNAIVGVIILVVANVAGVGVAIKPIAVLVCAVGGVPGAILVILLAYLEIAFAGTVAPLAALALV